MADDGNNKRSNIVVLTVLGLVTSVAIADKVIPQGVAMHRNLYANRADCERDYPPSQCESESSGSGGSSGGGHYHGPYYSASRSSAGADDPGAGYSGGTRAMSVESSYRGGFGAFGRAVHAAA